MSPNAIVSERDQLRPSEIWRWRNASTTNWRILLLIYAFSGSVNVLLLHFVEVCVLPLLRLIASTNLLASVFTVKDSLRRLSRVFSQQVNSIGLVKQLLTSRCIRVQGKMSKWHNLHQDLPAVPAKNPSFFFVIVIWPMFAPWRQKITFVRQQWTHHFCEKQKRWLKNPLHMLTHCVVWYISAGAFRVRTSASNSGTLAKFGQCSCTQPANQNQMTARADTPMYGACNSKRQIPECSAGV